MKFRFTVLVLLVCFPAAPVYPQDAPIDSRIPQLAHNLLLDAKVSGNLPSFKKGLRGAPGDVIYDLMRQRFVKETEWHEYGIGYQQDIGVVAEKNPAWWMAEWKSPVEANRIVLTGVYSNQPQPDTAWKIELRKGGKWLVHERGVGGWYDQGRYVWGGGEQKPIRFDALRVSLFSKDDKTPLRSILFRGEERASWLVCLATANHGQRAAASRVNRDLQALYTFDAGRGDVVKDRSRNARPLNLKIEKPSAVQWQNGSLVIRSSTKIASISETRSLVKTFKKSGGVTIEAWIKPQSDQQKGPARIVSMSSGSSRRNFTLGQDRDRFDVRFRTTSTDKNGMPSTATPKGTVKHKLTHVVYTRDSKGRARLFINGKQQSSKQVGGKVTGWNETFQLTLANESTGDRPWLGELHLVAIYNRDLTPGEIRQNFVAGSHSTRPPEMFVEQKIDPKVRHFESHIAPLLASRCLQCHDTATKKGKLDLSRKLAALAGGESGKVIFPGKAAESLLWEQIASGDMPPEGAPLSDGEKKLIRGWIDSGAVWAGEVIDPAVYARSDSAGEVWVQRLTVSEYIETVRATVGIDIEKEAREILPPDLRADGFSNTAYNLNVDLKHVEAYARLAEMIVDRMDVLKFAKRFSKSRSLNTDASARKFVAAMGGWICRGPLSKREEVIYSGIATTVASAGGSYEDGVALIIEAMLQSPRFIYRVEDQRGEGPVGEHELASRLSYIIWGGPPDETLMRAADDGELFSREHVESQAHRMLQDPRAIVRSEEFIADWLDVDRLANMRPDPDRFPNWNAELAADMRQETLSFFEEVVWTQKRPLADLFNAQVTFATPRLAKHYGLKPRGTESSRYDLSDVPARGGLLTQGTVLTMGGDDASMVTRGLFVLNDVLRGTVGDPPPGLDTTPVPSKPGLSQRLIAEQRIANTACAGCHSKFEPLAFGLEKFDGIGAYSDHDEFNNELRNDGEVLFPGEAKPVPYKTSSELMDLLASNDRVRESITWKLTQFALGRPLGPADSRIVREIHEAAQKNGGTYQSLIAAIVTSDLVMMQRTE